MTHPLFDLSNRVALVSGAASGLGKAMATGLAEAGADLVLADINPDGLATTAIVVARGWQEHAGDDVHNAVGGRNVGGAGGVCGHLVAPVREFSESEAEG